MNFGFLPGLNPFFSKTIKPVNIKCVTEMSPTIRKDCPCPKKTCERFTLCDECEAVHVAKGGLPFCRRPKRSFWGKIRKFLGMRK